MKYIYLILLLFLTSLFSLGTLSIAAETAQNEAIFEVG